MFQRPVIIILIILSDPFRSFLYFVAVIASALGIAQDLPLSTIRPLDLVLKN
jgi:hypothetical protein